MDAFEYLCLQGEFAIDRDRSPLEVHADTRAFNLLMAQIAQVCAIHGVSGAVYLLLVVPQFFIELPPFLLFVCLLAHDYLSFSEVMLCVSPFQFFCPPENRVGHADFGLVHIGLPRQCAMQCLQVDGVIEKCCVWI